MSGYSPAPAPEPEPEPEPIMQMLECLTLNSIVNVINSSGNKYLFNGLTNYDPNKVFGLSIGNYVFQDISSSHPMALLNNDISNLISYSGDSSKKSTKDVSGITYDFYYGDINVSVNGDFSGLSVYCFNHGYMGGENLLKYSDTCHLTTTTNQPSNALKCLSQESRVNIVSFNQNTNKYVFNNELIYDPTIRYGLYNGNYVLQNIPQSHPMAILNYNISGVLTYTGDLSKNFTKIIDDISYDFYYGDISINVTGPFGNASIACYNHETMRMDYIFSYNIFCNPQATITTPPVNRYVFNNNNIIVSQNNSNEEKNYFINYNNTKRPWKLNTSYISHNNGDYENESLKQRGDYKEYNFSIDSSKNNLRIESVDSNIDLFTHNTNSINLQGTTNFNNNTYFNNSAIFRENVNLEKTITTQNLVADEISANTIRLSNTQTFNFIGDLNIDGNININSGVGGQVGRILNDYIIQNSIIKNSDVNDSQINNSLIGFTTPRQAIFTDVSINNLLIENNLNINNNLNLKNIEENGYIYATLNSNNSDNIYKIHNNNFQNYRVLFFIENTDLTFELPNINPDENNNERQLNEIIDGNSIKYRFYLEKNNNYYFNFFNKLTDEITNNEYRAIGLYFNNESKIDIKYSDNNETIQEYNIDNKNYYIIYHRDFSNNYSNNKSKISLNIKGNFEFSDLVLLNTYTTPFTILNTFEKVFLYKHDINLIDKIEIIDNSINTLLTSDYDASFSNLNINNDISLNQKLFVGSDVSLNSKLFVEDDVSLNAKLFVEHDVSLNSKLFVQDDVSLNSKLFVENDVSLNAKLFVENDVSLNSKLFVASDVSLNNKLFVASDVSLNSKLNVALDVSLNSKLFVDNDVSLNSKLFVQDDVLFNDKLIVASDVSLNSKLFVQDDVLFNDKLIVASDVSLNSKLFVASDVSFNSNVNVNNNITIDGSANLNYIDVSNGYIYNTIIGYDSNDNLNPISGQKANFSTTNTNDLIVRNSINFYDSSGLTFDQTLLSELNRIKSFLNSNYGFPLQP